MSNKKILSVKPTKNPHKFIFETEMSADELAQLMQAEFPNNYECIVSIKPTGLWKNKLFVTVHESYLDSDNLNTMATILNKKLEAEEAKSHLTYLIAYKVPGYLGERFFVNEQTARKFANACSQKKQVVYHEQRGYYAEHITLIRNDETGEQLWPKETEQKNYCEVVALNRPVNDHISHRWATIIISARAYIHKQDELGARVCRLIHYKDINGRDTAVWCDDIKHIYDENGKDMLADGLAKAQKPADVWHVSIDSDWRKGYDVVPGMGERIRTALIELGDKIEYSSVHEIHFKDTSSVEHCVFAHKITCIRTANNRVIWSKKMKQQKPEDTSFKAPSLLSRIYE